MLINTNLVSVLIRTFNRPVTLAKAVDAVLQQTHRPLEVILVNDGGQAVDPELKQRALQQQVDLTLVNLDTNQGRSNAANVALKHAQGEALLFLDDDDWIDSSHVAGLLKVLQGDAELIAAYSDTACVFSAANPEVQKVFDYDYDPLHLAYENYLPIHSVLFKNNALSQACQFNTQLDVYEDWNFWLQMAAKGPMQRVPGITAWYSAQLSGVGFGVSIQGFSAELAKFFKLSACFYSAEQISVMLFMCRNFFSVAKANKHHEEVVSQLQLSLLETNCRQEQEASIDNQLNQLTKDFQMVKAQQQQQQLAFEIALTNEAKIVSNQLNQLAASIHATNLQQQASLQAEILTQQQAQQQQASLQAEMLTELQAQQQQLQATMNENLYAIRMLAQQKRGVAAWPWFIKISSKTRTLLQLVVVGDLQGIKIRLLRNTEGVLKKIRRRFTAAPVAGVSAAAPIAAAEPQVNANGITLLCTAHTEFVAKLLQQQLQSFGLTVNSLFVKGAGDAEPLQYDASLHIIICAQLFKKMPARYVVFQMEQSVSSRWFDADYARILNNAEAVLDYSKLNLAYLQEQQSVPFAKLYYLPISNLPVNSLSVNSSSTSQENPADYDACDYDVVFYGDVHNPRRKLFLDAISKQFKTLIVSEVFGDALYAQLQRAKVLVNIHYYEGALLETTRIYEALSLGLNIVSEVSVDQADHAVLDPWVTFTPIGDLDAMLQAIQAQLDTPRSLAALPTDLAGAKFHVGRLLVGLGLISPLAVKTLPAVLSSSAMQQPLCLSMPESYKRHATFRERHPSVGVFHGLRFNIGWIGCALSYSYLAQQALLQGNNYLEVWEDDVVLSPDALQRWQKAKDLFLALEVENVEKAESAALSEPCDLLSGLLADVSDATQILDYFEQDGESYVIIDRMISAVCNFYGKKPLTYMANWDCMNQDVHLNTMDRYLEKKDLRVLVPLPFVAGHNPEQDSTLWGCQNSQYDTMIAASEAKLYDKLQGFKLERITNGGVG